MEANDTYHVPVLLQPTLDLLAIKPHGTYVDCTLGGGGHFRALLAQLGETATLVGIDRDADALAWNRLHLPESRTRVILRQSRFSQLDEALRAEGIGAVDGVLADLGVSSHQINTADRGFSYLRADALDMRMNRIQGESAADLVNTLDEGELARVLSEYGEIQEPGRMARAIVAFRNGRRIETAADLRECFAREYRTEFKPALLARIFQALRIAVNEELSELQTFLAQSESQLAPGGRLVVIAYHSLEDRLVKNFFRDGEHGCTCPKHFPQCVCGNFARLKRVTKHAVRPSDEEIRTNPRSRSARLRAAERTQG
jgi:16S rRNA (cytosine1402-N4)-methyltransferase